MLYIFDRSDFFGAFLSITAEIFVTGILSLGMRTGRVSIAKDLPKIKAALPVFIIIELINWAALYTGQSAVKMGVTSLVSAMTFGLPSAIEASIPAFAFGISLSITMLTHKVDIEPS